MPCTLRRRSAARQEPRTYFRNVFKETRGSGLAVTSLSSPLRDMGRLAVSSAARKLSVPWPAAALAIAQPPSPRPPTR